MKQINIREFCLRPASYLKELPITLTRYGIPVALVTSPTGFVPFTGDIKHVDIGKKLCPDGFKVTEPEVDSDQFYSKSDMEIALEPLMKQKQIRLCKHGSAIGNCKFGCKS